jgi:DnaK suppressor protein
MSAAGVSAGKMEQKDLDYFKDLLNKWLQDLLNQADNTVMGLMNNDVNPSDPLDRAVVDTERSYTLRMRDRESILIRKIRRSLEDIEDDIYGICEECGQDIAIERLKARPVARRCIKCKTQQEAVEKLIGI